MTPPTGRLALTACHCPSLQPAFLERLAALQPDLCVTAAYGNMLPKAFLALPRLGTLNIHPSLLPLYRGAAPVQRAVQARRNSTATTNLHGSQPCRGLNELNGIEWQQCLRGQLAESECIA